MMLRLGPFIRPTHGQGSSGARLGLPRRGGRAETPGTRAARHGPRGARGSDVSTGSGRRPRRWAASIHESASNRPGTESQKAGAAVVNTPAGTAFLAFRAPTPPPHAP